MAEVTIANLVVGGVTGGEGLPDGPGQTTSSAAKRSFITSLGPIKIEWNFFQQDSDDDFANDDTFTTKLARPFAVGVIPVNVDTGAATAFNGSATGEFREANSSYRTITLRDCDAVNGLGLVVIVIGF